MKQQIAIIILILYVGCSNDKQDAYKRLGTDTVFTSTNIALDVISGEYKTVTAMKIRFDNTRLDSTDSTRVQWFRDSVYKFELSVTEKDSTGKMVYDSSGHPKKQKFMQEIQKHLILEDYNREWPIKIGKE